LSDGDAHESMHIALIMVSNFFLKMQDIFYLKNHEAPSNTQKV